ncbi:hypothetical protein GUITHDRAFT_166711 [Guillardia theta CCMP2712]|uniref:Uncharacterized protein n=1 Tax=Guillardia theta (strain CCMP2712) TaxID=905079 RepID=L1I8M4_GUITC|nr:hypothetical protein GUITHDRAFT_166711 [Guillardia theta CCMP2712]EKX32432.1 hypothetical protein GUITHDRAFT_166711 [Guillardia theta CCMP2712]|eukprot:XP_005819412.1 hypothetical protein GUITHDRAFT_166711 [Guillardia theta CCMP2712]
MSDVEILLVSLSEAAKNGNVDKLKEVLAVCSQELVNDSSASSSGYTPLHYAAWNGMGKSVELLAAAKADVNAADKYGRTPLHLAARMGMIAVIGAEKTEADNISCTGGIDQEILSVFIADRSIF